MGRNAQGKTSLLEALSLCTHLASFRTSRTEELISIGQTQASVKLELVRPTSSDVIISLEQKKRDLKVDGTKISSKSKYQFLGSSVSFVPDDLYLIKGGPEPRRHYIDLLAVSIQPQAGSFFQQFTKILKHRNQLLKRFKEGRGDQQQLELWTQQYIDSAVKIYEQRNQVVKLLNQKMIQLFEDLFHTGEKLEILFVHGYEQDIPNYQDLELRLLRVAEAEKSVGYSLVGPQRDDFSFQLNGLDAKNFASQGQTRSLVVALKLAQVELIRESRGMDPILLLDDIISELDEGRIQALIQYLSQYSGQLFVTTAEIDKLKKLNQVFPDFKLIELDFSPPILEKSRPFEAPIFAQNP